MLCFPNFLNSFDPYAYVARLNVLVWNTTFLIIHMNGRFGTTFSPDNFNHFECIYSRIQNCAILMLMHYMSFFSNLNFWRTYVQTV